MIIFYLKVLRQWVQLELLRFNNWIRKCCSDFQIYLFDQIARKADINVFLKYWILCFYLNYLRFFRLFSQEMILKSHTCWRFTIIAFSSREKGIIWSYYQKFPTFIFKTNHKKFLEWVLKELQFFLTKKCYRGKFRRLEVNSDNFSP